MITKTQKTLLFVIFISLSLLIVALTSSYANTAFASQPSLQKVNFYIAKPTYTPGYVQKGLCTLTLVADSGAYEFESGKIKFQVVEQVHSPVVYTHQEEAHSSTYTLELTGYKKPNDSSGDLYFDITYDTLYSKYQVDWVNAELYYLSSKPKEVLEDQLSFYVLNYQPICSEGYLGYEPDYYDYNHPGGTVVNESESTPYLNPYYTPLPEPTATPSTEAFDN